MAAEADQMQRTRNDIDTRGSDYLETIWDTESNCETSFLPG